MITGATFSPCRTYRYALWREWDASRPTVVACWGNNIRERDAWELRRMLKLEGVRVHALKLTNRGNPQHPLYLPKTLKPRLWAGTLGAEVSP